MTNAEVREALQREIEMPQEELKMVYRKPSQRSSKRFGKDCSEL